MNLVAVRREPVPSLIKALELLLEDAKAGLVRDVAWAAVREGSEISTARVGEATDVFRLVGAMRALEHRLLEGIG